MIRLKIAVAGLFYIFGGNVLAQSTPVNSDKLLWSFSSYNAGQKTKQFCATTKAKPYSTILCFGEVVRSNLEQPTQGYVEFRSDEKGTFSSTYPIVRSSAWKYIGKDSGYVANADIYERELTVRMLSGEQFVLTEVFGYFANYDEYDRLRTREIKGTLPNGQKISLTNIYMFY